jgi:hypothetical protein
MALFRKDVQEGDFYSNFPRFGYGKVLTHKSVSEWYTCIRTENRIYGIAAGRYGGAFGADGPKGMIRFRRIAGMC